VDRTDGLLILEFSGIQYRGCTYSTVSPTGRRPRGRPRTRWRDYVSRLAWERLGIPQEEVESVAGEKEAWGGLLSRLPPRPSPPDKRTRTNGWMHISTVYFTILLNMCRQWLGCGLWGSNPEPFGLESSAASSNCLTFALILTFSGRLCSERDRSGGEKMLFLHKGISQGMSCMVKLASSSKNTL